MKLSSFSSALALAAMSAAVFAPSSVDAHAYLVKPKSRETGAVEDPQGRMGCPTNNAGESASFQPGEKIDVRYWRNNYVGGFIRWAIVPRGQKTKKNFDKNVFFYTCRTMTEAIT